MKRNIDMYQSILTIQTVLKKYFATKALRVNGDALKFGGTVARQLNNDKSY